MNTYEDFRRVVCKERENLTRLSDLWNSKINCDKSFTKELQGRIRATVGKTRLLLAEKFKQFENLIDQSENNTAEKEISINDLEGFWDLVLIQVNEIKEIFKDLEQTKIGKSRSRESDMKDVKYVNFTKKKSFDEHTDQTEKKCRESREKYKTRSQSREMKNNFSHSKI